MELSTALPDDISNDDLEGGDLVNVPSFSNPCSSCCDGSLPFSSCDVEEEFCCSVVIVVDDDATWSTASFNTMGTILFDAALISGCVLTIARDNNYNILPPLRELEDINLFPI